MPLPDFVPPMLAKIGQPFDDPGWLFEIKWDGTRALAFAEGGDYRLINRNRNVVRERYPELGALARLPDGTIVDGEITVLVDGKPSFRGMLRREQARGEARFRALAADLPAVYVAFDLLWKGGEPIIDTPLTTRRDALRELVTALDAPNIQFSEGIVGEGLATFEHACAQELEGVVAKRLDSTYRPGVRTEAWLKIKRTQHAAAVVLGYLPAGRDDLKSLVIGMEEDGRLVPVGRVGSGLDDGTRARLVEMLRSHVTEGPVVAVPRYGPEEVAWVEPAVFCEVKFLERTRDGQLRAPVFVRLLDG
jgi:bifunctional non-homologous end joining protein LigD